MKPLDHSNNDDPCDDPRTYNVTPSPYTPYHRPLAGAALTNRPATIISSIYSRIDISSSLRPQPRELSSRHVQVLTRAPTTYPSLSLYDESGYHTPALSTPQDSPLSTPRGNTFSGMRRRDLLAITRYRHSVEVSPATHPLLRHSQSSGSSDPPLLSSPESGSIGQHKARASMTTMIPAHRLYSPARLEIANVDLFYYRASIYCQNLVDQLEALEKQLVHKNAASQLPNSLLAYYTVTSPSSSVLSSLPPLVPHDLYGYRLKLIRRQLRSVQMETRELLFTMKTLAPRYYANRRSSTHAQQDLVISSSTSSSSVMPHRARSNSSDSLPLIKPLNQLQDKLPKPLFSSSEPSSPTHSSALRTSPPSPLSAAIGEGGFLPLYSLAESTGPSNRGGETNGSVNVSTQDRGRHYRTETKSIASISHSSNCPGKGTSESETLSELRLAFDGVLGKGNIPEAESSGKGEREHKDQDDADDSFSSELDEPEYRCRLIDQLLNMAERMRAVRIQLGSHFGLIKAGIEGQSVLAALRQGIDDVVGKMYHLEAKAEEMCDATSLIETCGRTALEARGREIVRLDHAKRVCDLLDCVLDIHRLRLPFVEGSSHAAPKWTRTAMELRHALQTGDASMAAAREIREGLNDAFGVSGYYEAMIYHFRRMPSSSPSPISSSLASTSTTSAMTDLLDYFSDPIALQRCRQHEPAVRAMLAILIGRPRRRVHFE